MFLEGIDNCGLIIMADLIVVYDLAPWFCNRTDTKSVYDNILERSHGKFSGTAVR